MQRQREELLVSVEGRLTLMMLGLLWFEWSTVQEGQLMFVI